MYTYLNFAYVKSWQCNIKKKSVLLSFHDFFFNMLANNYETIVKLVKTGTVHPETTRMLVAEEGKYSSYVAVDSTHGKNSNVMLV